MLVAGVRVPRAGAALLGCAVLVVLTARLGAGWQLPAFLYLGVVGTLLALVDLRAHRLPDALVLPSYAVAAALLALPAAVHGLWPAYARALLGGAALYGGYLALALAYPDGLGFGDVKLAGVLGLYLGWLGWPALLVGTFLGFLLGGGTALALLLARRASATTRIPFGPAMLLGALIAICAGEPIAALYTGSGSL